MTAPLLAIETATARVGAALVDDSGVLASCQVTRGRRHAELLVPMVSRLCADAGIALDDVAAVGVDVGPGLFTGLRVGIATAQGIAYARGVPVVGVTSLDVVAHPLLAVRDPMTTGMVVPALDARRGEVYACAMSVGPSGRVGVEAAPRVWAPEALVEWLDGMDRAVVVVGDGGARYRDLLVAAGVEVADDDLALPAVEAVARLAWREHRLGGGVAASLVRPVYLRAPDAEINWITRERV